MSQTVVDLPDALQTIYSRRAVRAYRAEPPSDEAIHALLDAAVRAPTAMHREPWGFVVVQDRTLLKRYSDRAKAALLEPSVALGWGSAPASRHDHPSMLADPAFNIFYDAGTLIVICRTESGKFAEADCWLAAENLMLAATARRLGTCVIGFAVGVLNTPEAKRELGIPEEGAAVAPIIIGTPREAPHAVARKAPRMLNWIK